MQTQTVRVREGGTARPRIGVIEDELTRLIVTLERILLAVFSHLSAKLQGMFVQGLIENGRHRVGTHRSEFVRQSITQDRVRGKIKTREPSRRLRSQVVERSRKPELS